MFLYLFSIPTFLHLKNFFITGVIKDDVLHTGYMAHLEETMQSINCTGSLDEEIIVNNATSYLNALITNLKDRFPQSYSNTLWILSTWKR